MNKVELFQGEEEGKTGLGVRINDRRATLADLLDAWQPACDDNRLFKLYARDHYQACKGCQVNCCNTAYVIPDLIALKRMISISGMDQTEFAGRYLDQEKRKLGLLRLKPNPCCFLENNVCTVYPDRALICRFYVCASILGQTEQAIYSITWTGIAAAQAYARSHSLVDSPPPGGYTSLDMMFSRVIEEFGQSPRVQLFMHAKDYSDIPLAPFLED
ncbi:MAG TPA: YkgJ family cysteine cluster protein [Syntrophomonadaceae bacterium]|nr:YkgJ family cysteine cluster protein [Syntrophomonadaceae bacterium]